MRSRHSTLTDDWAGELVLVPLRRARGTWQESFGQQCLAEDHI